MIPTLREVGDGAGAGRLHARRVGLADVLADHAAVDPLGGDLRRRPDDAPAASASTARSPSSPGNIEGKTETATLRVQDEYENFNLPGAYAISLALAAIAILVLVVMTALRPKEGTA